MGLPWSTDPGGPVVKTALPLQGVRVRSLVRKIRHYMYESMKVLVTQSYQTLCDPVDCSP